MKRSEIEMKGFRRESEARHRDGRSEGEINMEYFDIRNPDGSLTGEIKERSKVHEDGDIHGTSHLWIVRKNEKGKYELLLQKRSKDKDAYPGCYDISSAGHLPAGQDFLPSALRELEEELGITASEEQMIFLGIHEGYSEEIFYGKPFRNHEISHVYLYMGEVDTDKLKLQKEEVESVKWMEFFECYGEVKNKNPLYCLFLDELEMIKNYFNISE